jgi:hypothetical protein
VVAIEVHRLQGEEPAVLVDAERFLTEVDAARARGEARLHDADPAAGWIEAHRGALRRRIRALNVAEPELVARVEAHTGRRVLARLGRDLNDARASARAVEARAGGALHHLDRLDVERVDVRRGAVEDDPVDDDERTLRAAGRVERLGATQHDCRRRAGTPIRHHDLRARHLALQLRQGIR